MKSISQALLYGVAVWAVPFIAAMLIFPLRESERPLFESIMPVVVTFSVVIFGVTYLTKADKNYMRESVLIGIIWLVISLLIDLLIFMWGPMKMSIADYMKDIGVTYLMIPIITTGLGKVLEMKCKIED